MAAQFIGLTSELARSAAKSTGALVSAGLTTTCAGTKDTTPSTTSSSAPVVTDPVTIATTTPTATECSAADDTNKIATKAIEPPKAEKSRTDRADATDHADHAAALDKTSLYVPLENDAAATKKPIDARETSVAQSAV